jgi:hypothetical protein
MKLAITPDQLVAAWSEARDGVEPDSATRMHLAAVAAQAQAGAISDDDALAHAAGSASSESRRASPR